MGYKIFSRPRLRNPVMIASWPGIGNIGIITADYLKQQVAAKELGEIEPWDFFYPNSISIKSNILGELQFPSSKFYYQRLDERDLIIFIGEEQPHEGLKRYAKGRKAYDMANLVVDFAEKFKCSRIYTSGAAVSLSHHSAKPRVWAVPNNKSLLAEIERQENTLLMSGIQGKKGQGAITGLNGLLIGVARKRGIDAMCLMGEIPVYLQGMLMPYPRASKEVINVLCDVLGIRIDMSQLDAWSQRVENKIEKLLEEFNKSLPLQLRDGVADGLEKLKNDTEKPDQLTEADAKRAIDEIEKFFRGGGQGDE